MASRPPPPRSARESLKKPKRPWTPPRLDQQDHDVSVHYPGGPPLEPGHNVHKVNSSH